MTKPLHSFTPFSLPNSVNCLYLFLGLWEVPWAGSKLERTYSKQIQNSWFFFHVAICCHFFGWAPVKRLFFFFFRGQVEWKYIFFNTENYFHFCHLVRLFTVSEKRGKCRRPGETAGLLLLFAVFLSPCTGVLQTNVYDLDWHHDYCIWIVDLSFTSSPHLFFLIFFRISIMGLS